MQKIAVAYARYSSSLQREESIEAQLYDIRKFAEKEGYKVIKEYVDQAVSGRATQRESFDAMVQDAESGHFKYIITHKVDRFGRNKYHSAMTKYKLRLKGIRVIYATQYIADTPEGNFTEHMLEGMAQYYSENLSLETKKGLTYNARKGLFNGGFPPLGYDIVDQQYVINEEEAYIVRTIFDMFLQGISQSQIVRLLDKKGYKTKRGNKFKFTSVTNILQNAAYTGVYEYGKTSLTYGCSGKRAVRVPNPPEEIIRVEDAIPSIIPKSDFARVQDLISKRYNMYQKKQKFNYPLKGHIYCNICNRTMGGNTSINKSGTPRSYYRCRGCGNAVRADRLQDKILEIAKLYFIDQKDKILDKTIKYAVQEDTSVNEKEIIRKKISTLQVQEQNTIEYLINYGANDSVSKKLNSIQGEILQLQSQLSQYPADVTISGEDVSKWFSTVESSILGDLNPMSLFPILVNHVEVSEDEVDVYFNFCSKELLTLNHSTHS